MEHRVKLRLMIDNDLRARQTSTHVHPLCELMTGEIRVDELDLWVLDRVESEAEEVVA